MNQLCYWHILTVYVYMSTSSSSSANPRTLKTYILQFLKLVLKMSQSLNRHVKCLLRYFFNTCSANVFVHSTKNKSKVDEIQIGLALKNVRNWDPSLRYSEKHGGSGRSCFSLDLLTVTPFWTANNCKDICMKCTLGLLSWQKATLASFIVSPMLHKRFRKCTINPPVRISRLHHPPYHLVPRWLLPPPPASLHQLRWAPTVLNRCSAWCDTRPPPSAFPALPAAACWCPVTRNTSAISVCTEAKDVRHTSVHRCPTVKYFLSTHFWINCFNYPLLHIYVVQHLETLSQNLRYAYIRYVTSKGCFIQCLIQLQASSSWRKKTPQNITCRTDHPWHILACTRKGKNLFLFVTVSSWPRFA